MGRPINKRYFGSLPDADADTMPKGDVAFNIPVEAAFIDGGTRLSEEGADIYILKQRSSRRFEVKNTDSNETAVCRLVNATDRSDSTAIDLSAGEMVILGYVGGSVDQAVSVAKMTNRLAYDFSGNKYTWSVSNDSTSTVLVLTAV